MSENTTRRAALKGALGVGVLGALSIGGANSAFAASHLGYPYVLLKVVSARPGHVVMDYYYYGKTLSTNASTRSYQIDSIRNIQRRLGLTQDGVFGSKTDSAVRAFQRSKGLVVDGCVGESTVRAMGMRLAE